MIADYARAELTEIDRNGGTFSITPFAEIARANESLPVVEAKGTTSDPVPRDIRQSADGRQLETVEFARQANGERVTVSVGVDRSRTLSADAVEALVGAAFPNRRGFAHEAILQAAAPPAAGRRVQTASVEAFALPSEQIVTYETGGERLTFRSTIVAIDSQTVPAELAAIPPGSRRVDSRLITVPRFIQQVDSLPTPDAP